MGLREDILNRPDLAESVEARDCGALAAAISVGRIRAVSHEVGERGILDALGPIQGDNFLTVLENIKTADDLPPPLKQCFGAIRRGVAWLKTSGLDAGALTTRLLLDGLAAAGVLPQADVSKVKALYNDDGSFK